MGRGQWKGCTVQVSPCPLRKHATLFPLCKGKTLDVTKASMYFSTVGVATSSQKQKCGLLNAVYLFTRLSVL